MKVVIENKEVRVTGADEDVKTALKDKLSYKDKSKEYQLRRLSKNPWNKKQAFYKKLQSEVYGSLYKEDGGDIILPSGFAHLLKNFDTTDNRCDTGEEISLPWKQKPFYPRPYQEEAVELMLDNWRGLINFATGLGKTLTAVHAIRKIKRKTLVLCPNVSIADNFYEELVNAFGENKVGYFGGGKKKIKDITVGIAQSVNNHVEKFKEADLGLMIIDEVHHVPASTFFSIASELGDIGRMYGLTATDFRSDGKDVMITAGVGKVLIKRDLVWGVENGWLAKPYIVVREIETTGRNYRDDKIKNYKAHVLNCNEMNNRIISDCQKFIAAGKSVLCLVNEVSHGTIISEALGVPLATGTDKKSTSYVTQLNNGEIPGLVLAKVQILRM
jgi:superfamily II DNA or RNA helicase